MARDADLRYDLKRARCRLAPYGFFKGQDLTQYIKSGDLQAGMIGDLPALSLAVERDLRIVSLVQQGPCAVIAREKMPLSGLKGKTVGIAPGSNASFTLYDLLQESGLSPKDVRTAPMDVFDMAPALESGRIDAFSAWEPTPTLALLDHPQFETVGRKDARGFLVFTRAFAERHPEAVKALLASEVRALRWLRLNDKNLYIASGWAHDRALAFEGTDLPLTVYDFLRLARRDLLRLQTAPRITPGLLAPAGELYWQFFRSQDWGLLPAGADWLRIRQSFDEDLVPDVLDAASANHLNALRLLPDPLGV
jgi:NitT/TauT family transport system substrate-binding protein